MGRQKTKEVIQIVQQTSLMAYIDLKESGKLGPMQAKVLEIIKKNPKKTDKELAFLANLPINSLIPRRFELQKMGLIRRVGMKTCPRTHKKAFLYKSYVFFLFYSQGLYIALFNL